MTPFLTVYRIYLVLAAKIKIKITIAIDLDMVIRRVIMWIMTMRC